MLELVSSVPALYHYVMTLLNDFYKAKKKNRALRRVSALSATQWKLANDTMMDYLGKY